MTTPPSDPWSIPPSSPPAPEPAMPEQTGSHPAMPHPAMPHPAMPHSAMPHPAAADRPAAGAGPVIVQIAEIAVTSTVVHTPTGDIPLAGSQWQVNDYWFTTSRIPRWAIVAAIAGFCVLTVFSLLFLLVKESVAQGTVQVTVTNGTRQYVARIPVKDQVAVTTINQQVNYVRTLAAL